MENQRTLRFKAPIMILAFVALAFTALSSITYFVGYDWYYGYSLTVRFPDFYGWISMLTTIAPFILYVIYVLKLHTRSKAVIIIIFGLLAFAQLYYYIEPLIYGLGFSLKELLFSFLQISAYALAIISAAKGFSKKVLLIIAVAIILLFELLSIINLAPVMKFYFEDELYLYFFTMLVSRLGTICLHVSFLLLGLKNRIPTISTASDEKEIINLDQISPEQALLLLNDKLELGMISEEEYRAQRAQIIAKL